MGAFEDIIRDIETFAVGGDHCDHMQCGYSPRSCLVRSAAQYVLSVYPESMRADRISGGRGRLSAQIDKIVREWVDYNRDRCGL